ncbi:transcription factor e(y)2-domain-containing protein [Melanogaster broomeanus]|nr:transcription factor e(y)2-domain-containing protein [Melanogaster broomeanus]
MSKSSSETDELYTQIHRRMVESGEWDRFLRLLSSKLSEHGWSDELCHRAKERARVMDPLSFRTVLEEISSHAQATVPPPIRREITNVIRQYVKDQFEK